jgi:3-oxoacyl-[acyl-carrier-protein] synthase-1
MKNPFKKDNEDICIIKCAMCSPLGINAEMTAAMIIAECTSFTPYKTLSDEMDKPVTYSKASYIEENELEDRFKVLMRFALNEVLEPIFGLETLKVSLFLGLPEFDENLPEQLTKNCTDIAAEIVKDNSLNVNIETFCKGHSSGLICLEKAIELLEKDKTEFCIVGGVDSYIERAYLYKLLKSKRIKSSMTKHGFIPGEGSGFFLITKESRANFYKFPILARICAVGSAMEKNNALGGKTCHGKGLSEAVFKVLGKIPDDKLIDKVYCDLNGERHRAAEYTYMISRNHDRIIDPGDYITTSSSHGDIGAATLSGLINLAVHHNTEKTTGLFLTGSDSGIRSAAIIKIEPQ